MIREERRRRIVRLLARAVCRRAAAERGGERHSLETAREGDGGAAENALHYYDREGEDKDENE